MKKWLYSILLISIIFFSYQSVLAVDVPKPNGDIYVQDFADLLPKKVEKEITELGTYLDKETKAKLSVLTVPSLQNTPINEYAEEAFRTYKLGDKNDENGILLLFAVQDRKIYIEVGNGLKEHFSPGMIGEILDSYSLPFLEKDNFQKAISNTYNQLFNEMAITYDLDKRASAKGYDYGQGSSSFLTILIFMFVFLAIIFLDFKFLGGAICFAILRILTYPLRRWKINRKQVSNSNHKQEKSEKRVKVRDKYRR
ncbi:TPM domain-containing protein [Lederbergia galactosidilytica]|uniref:TPM domain-containing protein n=1 Tax=Lederbergia galactosidilytica TaxID=217031 RepID=UPI0007171FA7|nr:TPM domain-containing protein [Lederbergia galactosidilytica]MBP1916601.1 uncharacterized protein [Lederbergia galactosidilytica]